METNEHEDVTPQQVATDLQACVNDIRNTMCNVSLIVGDEWPELEESIEAINRALDVMEGKAEEVRNGR